MKGVKGKLLKKLKTIRTIKPDRILHVNVKVNAAAAAEGFIDNLIAKANIINFRSGSLLSKQQDPIHDVSAAELQLIEEDEEMDLGSATGLHLDKKENIVVNSGPGSMNPPDKLTVPDSDSDSFSDQRRRRRSSNRIPLSELQISSCCFHPPDLDSSTLFDPKLLAAFRDAVMDVKKDVDCAESLLSRFQDRCPPRGKDAVILYTTGLRGIRKTFEDCTSVRFLLESLQVSYQERDMSLHAGFKEELWATLGERLMPPRLFIKGRYIGGAEDVLRLHEQGRFRPLLDGIPVRNRAQGPCQGCAGIRFLVCLVCHGSRKLRQEVTPVKCQDCNENGLIICPVCC